MTFNKKLNYLIILILLSVNLFFIPKIIQIFSPNILSTNLNENTKLINLQKLKTSQPVHNLTGAYIEIDDTNPSKNWSYTKATYPWLTQGDGSELTPYVLEDIIVVNPPYGVNVHCIIIRNSWEHFTIKNCEFKFSYYPYGDGSYGILLDNVTNGRIIQNNCSDNEGGGIKLLGSSDNWVSGNNINYNDGPGVQIAGNSYNNTFYDNNVKDNDYGFIIDGNDNLLLENTVINCVFGVTIFGDNNEITNNEFNNNNRGISIYGNNNSIISNKANNNRDNGIYLASSNNLIYNNTLSSNSIGINFDNICTYNNISENILNNNGYGIYLDNRLGWNTIENNIISKNTINYNVVGIYLINVQFNNITGNSMKYCGIFFDWLVASMSTNYISDTNLVNGKKVYFYQNETNLWNSNFTNAGQIILVNCSDSQFSNLDLSHGTIGVSIFGSTNIFLSNIQSSNNTVHGIYTIGGSQYKILNSFTNENGDGGIIIKSTNCTVKENEANYNNYGIYVISSNSYILDNIAHFNAFNGIYVYGGLELVISRNNLAQNNQTGLYAYGIAECYISENDVDDNIINGIHLKGCYNNTVTLNTISNHDMTPGEVFQHTQYNGLLLESSSNNTISKNLMNANHKGLHLYSGSHYNTVYENEYINEGPFKIAIYVRSDLNLISEEIINGGDWGIYLLWANNNTILRNTIKNVLDGIWLENSDYNDIINNSITLNQAAGIILDYSSYNRIIGNKIQNHAAGYCIVERNDCIGNIFENNVCTREVPTVSGFNYLIVIGIISILFVIISRRISKFRKKC